MGRATGQPSISHADSALPRRSYATAGDYVMAVDAETIKLAREFALARWREYVAELARLRKRPYTEPKDLSNACRFAATFAREIFGGHLEGNWYHVWCIAPDGQRLDLTDGVQFKNGVPEELRARARRLGLDVADINQHDPRVWRELEFRRAMGSVEDVAQRWALRFREQSGAQL